MQTHMYIYIYIIHILSKHFINHYKSQEGFENGKYNNNTSIFSDISSAHCPYCDKMIHWTEKSK